MISSYLEVAANIVPSRPQELSIRNVFKRDQAQKSISQDTVKTVIAVTVILGVIFIAFALFVIYWMYMRSIDRRERTERDKRDRLYRPENGRSKGLTSNFRRAERHERSIDGGRSPRSHKDSRGFRGKCTSVVKILSLIMIMEQRARQGIPKRSRNLGIPAFLQPWILRGPTVSS